MMQITNYNHCHIDIAYARLTYIVLFLYIYIALLTAHTNQKRFQCERPREKRVHVSRVLRSYALISRNKSCIYSHCKRVVVAIRLNSHIGRKRIVVKGEKAILKATTV